MDNKEQDCYTQQRKKAKAFIEQVFDMAVQQGLTYSDLNLVRRIFSDAVKENQNEALKVTKIIPHKIGEWIRY